MRAALLALIALPLLTLPSFARASVGYDDASGTFRVNSSGSDGGNGGSGSDGSSWSGAQSGGSGGDGDDAGDISLRLSYADDAKTQIKIDGEVLFGSRRSPFSKIYPASSLRSIDLVALGGDGGRGGDGGSGARGEDGRNGEDGCNPTSGENGQNGGNGADGGSGGDGGRGGLVRIDVQADQSELLLLVNVRNAGGSGGSAGSGGGGGSGGSGGRGGSGRCWDSTKNEWVFVMDGSSGWSGSSGSSGGSGWSGRDGANGARRFEVGGKIYASPFTVSLASVKVVDDNEDGIFEPGEDLHVTEITLANNGGMPTPVGSVKIQALDDGDFQLRRQPVVSLAAPLAAGASQKFVFGKGEFTLHIRDQEDRLGREIGVSIQISINAIIKKTVTDTVATVRRPVSLSGVQDTQVGYFGSSRPLAYTLKNASAKAFGAGGRTVSLELSWTGKSVPGSDVVVTLKDGRKLTLGTPALVTGLDVAAKSSLAVPLTVLVKNSKDLAQSSGSLKVSLKLQGLDPEKTLTAGSLTAPFQLALDLRPTTIQRELDLSKSKLKCVFPRALNKNWNLKALSVQKAAGTDKVSVQITVGELLAKQKSPVMTISAHAFAGYTRSLTTSASADTVIAFINALVVPASRGLDRSWVLSACGKAQ